MQIPLRLSRRWCCRVERGVLSPIVRRGEPRSILARVRVGIAPRGPVICEAGIASRTAVTWNIGAAACSVAFDGARGGVGTSPR